MKRTIPVTPEEIRRLLDDIKKDAVATPSDDTVTESAPSRAARRDLRLIQRLAPDDPWTLLVKRIVEPMIKRFRCANRSDETAPVGGIFNRPIQTAANAPAALPADAPRIVWLVGSRASDQMPVWDDLRKDVVNEAEKGFADFVLEAWRILRLEIGRMHDQWEEEERKRRLIELASTDMLCSVVSRLTSAADKVRELIVKKYATAREDTAGPRPQLAFELLGHMLKHGFCDHVISFSPDGLLDAAIETELITNYRLVESPSPNAADADPDVIHVVKMRGSARTAESLRVARSPQILTPNLQDLLDRLVFADGRPVYIITLGYAWNHDELTRWLRGWSERIVAVTALLEPDMKAPALSSCPRAKRIDTSKLLRAEPPIRRRTDAPGRDYLSADHCMWVLWQEIDKKLNGSAPTAARHLILSQIFGPVLQSDGSTKGHFNNIHRLEDRYSVEMLLHIIKSQGMVPLRNLPNNPRIQKFACRLGPDVREDVRKLLLQPSRLPEGQEVLYSAASNSREFAEMFERQLDLGGHQVLVPRVEDGRIGYVSQTFNDFVHEHVQRILDQAVVEVLPGSDPFNREIFRDCRPLTSLTMLCERSALLLKTPWTHLFTVSESGGWLAKHLTGTTELDREVLLIRAASPRVDEWPYMAKWLEPRMAEDIRRLDRTSVHYGELQWWKHNRHLTLAFSSEQGFLGGVFLRRSLKEWQVQPVYLHDAQDCAALLLTFLRYARRLARQQLNPAPSGVVENLAGTHDFLLHVAEASEHVRSRIGDGQIREAIGRLSEDLRDIADKLLAKKRIKLAIRGSSAIVGSEAMNQLLSDLRILFRKTAETEEALGDSEAPPKIAGA